MKRRVDPKSASMIPSQTKFRISPLLYRCTVLCNKSKNASVHFFICTSSMSVPLFTAFAEAVLKLYVPW